MRAAPASVGIQTRKAVGKPQYRLKKGGSSQAVIQHRKERNRNAAQKSRDRKHLYVQAIECENNDIRERFNQVQLQLQSVKELCFRQQMEIKHLQSFPPATPPSPTWSTSTEQTQFNQNTLKMCSPPLPISHPNSTPSEC